MTDIARWLEGLGLGKYVTIFADAEVDLAAVSHLTEDDLKELGLPLGPRRKILAAVATALTNVLPPSADTVVPHTSARGEAERRQLTVMFCDLVGSTALSTRLDPEDMRQVIRAYQDACSGAIARYDGFVAKFMGDGILAYFGYPRAHEDDAERSVRAGLEIAAVVANLETLAEDRLKVRIGIATGLVVVGDLIGQGSSQEQSVVGDTPNLAARLQGLAEPGSIVVSEQVRRLAGGSFDYEDLGEMALKGIAQPTHAYSILGASETTSRFEAATQEGLTPLVGRDQEIGLLLERWKLAQDGEGQVVLLSGEPGIGKSRILSGLRGRLEGLGARALRFQCSPYYVNSALWPIIGNFERALRFGRDEQPQSKLDKLEALIVNDHGRPLGDVRFIASMLSVPWEERYEALALTPEKNKDETLRALVEITAAAARKQPSVMLFEDAHWADPTTLEVLDLLIDRIATVPLLIVLTHRPEFQPKWTKYGHVSALNLSKLTKAQSSAMVSEVAGSKALPPGLVEQIAIRTDGVPLFVEELTKSILESGELKEVGDRYEYVGSGRNNVTIPATLRDSLMARLDRFAPVKEIAQIGAAIGREFSYELVEAVWPRVKSELDTALQQLTDSGLAFRRGPLPEVTYTFKHALVRDAAYDSLLKSRRQELHNKIARVIEDRFQQVAETKPEVLAHHYTQAGLIDLSVNWWEKAGQHALERSANVEAVAHYRSGLALLADLAPDRRGVAELSLQLGLGTALTSLKGYADPETGMVYQCARELCLKLGDRRRLYPVLYGLWNFPNVGGDHPRARKIAQELVDLAEEHCDVEAMIAGYSALGTTLNFMGRWQEAYEAYEKCIALYDPEKHATMWIDYTEDLCVQALAQEALTLWNLDDAEGARSVLDRAEVLAGRLGHANSIAYPLALRAIVCFVSDQPDEALRAADVCIAHAGGVGLPFWEALAAVYRGWGLACRGEGARGIADIRAALQSYRATGAGVLMSLNVAALADACRRAGRKDEALAAIEEGIETANRQSEGVCEPELQRLKALLILETAGGATERGLDQLRRALVVAQAQGSRAMERRIATDIAGWVDRQMAGLQKPDSAI